MVVIEASEDGVYLYRYSANGDFGGDTWHESVEDAKHQAAFEYADLLSEWHEVPDITDLEQYVVDEARGGE